MKQWLFENGPLMARFDVYSDIYSYKSGVYVHNVGEKEGGHAICVIG